MTLSKDNLVIGISTFLFVMAPYKKIGVLEPLYWSVIFVILYFFFKKLNIKWYEMRFYLIPIILHLLCLIFKSLYYNSFNIANLTDFLKNVHTSFVAIVVFSYFIHFSKQKINEALIIQQKVIFFILILLSFVGISQYLNFTFIENFIEPIFEIKKTHKLGYDFTNFELEEKLSRVNGIFGSPLAFASTLSPFIIVLYSVKNRIKVNAVYFILFIFVLFLTYSRASFITCLLVLFFLSINRVSKLQIFQLIISLLVIYIFYQYFFNKTTNFDRFEEFFTYVFSGFDDKFTPSSFLSRIEYMTVIFEYFSNNSSIYTGLDLKTFKDELEGYSFESQYFAWYVKYGIWGVGFLIWYILLAKRFFNYNKKLSNIDKFTKTIIYSTFLVLVTNFIVGLTQQSVHGRHNREVIFFTIGLIEAYIYLLKKEKNVDYK